MVPLDTLTAAPFSLILGDAIVIKVTAHNTYGASPVSETGSGANIVLVPGAPVDFADVTSITSATRIGLSWSAPASSGGKPVLDYRIYFDQSTDTWVELAPAVNGWSYNTDDSLVQGRTYKFRVQARNSVGYGAFSGDLSILAA